MTWLRPKTSRRALAAACMFTVLGVQIAGVGATVATAGPNQNAQKLAKSDRLNELGAAIVSMREQLGLQPSSANLRRKLGAAQAEYQSISASLGGDKAVGTGTGGGQERSAAELGLGTLGVVPPAPANCTPTTASVTNNTPVAVPTGPGVVTSTVVVSGAGPYLWDVNLRTFLTHAFNADVDMTIASPAGTVVTLTTDNGSSFDNVFNGTVWDDDADPGGQVPYAFSGGNDGVVTDSAYADNVVETPLVPEEAMGAFIGENPNGTWTITVSDDDAGIGGSLNSWTLEYTTFATAPTNAAPLSFGNPTDVPISAAAASTVTSQITVSGAGTTLCDLNATTFIQHTYNADLQITITSPAGTIVTLTTNNSLDDTTVGGQDNVYNGTLWDDDADPDGQVPYVTNAGLATDHPYANNVVATPLVPEEAMGAFIGENPNGTWTLTVADNFAGDGGLIDSWGLRVVTCTCVAPVGCTLVCPANVTTTATSPDGAVVTFPAPTLSGNCPNGTTVTTTPASGSLFPVGTTTVTGTASTGATPAGTTTVCNSGTTTINDLATVTSTITIPASAVGPITNVTVSSLAINHAFAADLDVFLISPSGTRVELFTDVCGTGVWTAANTNFTLADTAATLIGTTCPPNGGTYRPEGLLSAVNGQNAPGVWTLEITDDGTGDVGSLTNWCLNVSTAGAGGQVVATCTFTVTVGIPFDANCVIDDASGDVFRFVTNVPVGSGLYGFYQYHVQATGETFCGFANVPRPTANPLKLTDNGTNNAGSTPSCQTLDATVYRTGLQVSTVRLLHRPTGRQFVIRDRNITNNVCPTTNYACSACSTDPTPVKPGRP